MIKYVTSLHEFATARFSKKTNAVAYIRPPRDFDALAVALKEGLKMHERPTAAYAREISINRLKNLMGRLKKDFRPAAQQILDDMTMLQDNGFNSVLSLSTQNVQGSALRFHHDDNGRGREKGIALCSYTVAATEGLHPKDAIKLRESVYYKARKGAKPFSFGLNSLWHFALEGGGIKPDSLLVHRAPPCEIDKIPRMVLVAGGLK